MPADNIEVNASFKKIGYAITVNQVEGATITATNETTNQSSTSTLEATIGNTIRVDAEVQEGYQLESIKYGDKTIENGQTFTIEDSSIAITAVVKKIDYTIGITKVEGATITVTNVTKNESSTNQVLANINDNIKVSVTVDAGYELESIKFDNKTITNNANITMTVGNKVVTATVKAKEYVVTYEYNGATGNNTSLNKIVTYKTNYGTLPTPTKEGYNFLGWYKESSCINRIEATTKMETPSDHKIYAKWTISSNRFTVNYDCITNGGTGSIPSTMVNYNVSIDLTKTCSKPGWTFVGWNTDKDATTKLDSLKMGTSNVNLYAIYKKEASTYTVTFEKATEVSQIGETSKQCSTKVVYNNSTEGKDCSITLPTMEAKAGYTVQGWYENSTKVGNAGANITISSNKTLTAKATANKIKITLATNGGTGGTTAFWYYYGTSKFYSDEACTTEITSITRPTRTGYTLISYYGDGSSGGNDGERYVAYESIEFASDLATDIYKDATLYANWTANKIKITLNANGGTGGTTAFWYYYGTSKFYSNEACTTEITSITKPTKNGYTFATYDGDGSSGGRDGEFFINADGKFASDLATDIYKDATLYAKWTANKIKLTLNNNGGSGGTTAVWYYYGTDKFYSNEDCTTQITSITKPTRIGYTLASYDGDGTSGGNNGEIYIRADGTFASDLYIDITKNATLTAKWTANKIKITLNANGGTGGTTAFWYYYGTSKFYSNEACTTEITAITKPTRSGYTFLSYYGDGTSGGTNGERYVAYDSTNFASDLATDIYKDAILYAKWEASFTLTCPSSSYTNREVNCSTNSAGITITCSGVSLSSSYAASETTTSSKKTKTCIPTSTGTLKVTATSGGGTSITRNVTISSPPFTMSCPSSGYAWATTTCSVTASGVLMECGGDVTMTSADYNLSFTTTSSDMSKTCYPRSTGVLIVKASKSGYSISKSIPITPNPGGGSGSGSGSGSRTVKYCTVHYAFGDTSTAYYSSQCYTTSRTSCPTVYSSASSCANAGYAAGDYCAVSCS